MMRTNSIPIILLTGFLGAGKTSLLNNLLQNQLALKIGVIINDFGKINVDSLLVSAQTASTLELSNGCICCTLEGEGLTGALDQLAHRGSRLDYIVIEASGLADIPELARSLQLLKHNYCHFDLLVNIVDADNFEANNQKSTRILEDLNISDFIIINKLDLVSKSKLADIRQAVRLAAPQSRLLESSHCQFDYRLLLEPALEERPSSQLKLADQSADHHDHHHQHLHEQFDSLEFQTKQPLDPQKFENWLKSLPLEVFRAKGLVFFGMKGLGQKYIFQVVGRRHQLKLAEWLTSEESQTQLVIIGVNLNKKILHQELTALIDDHPDDVNQATLMDPLLYK